MSARRRKLLATEMSPYENIISGNRFPMSRGILLNKHLYDVVPLARWLSIKQEIPHSCRRPTPQEYESIMRRTGKVKHPFNDTLFVTKKERKAIVNKKITSFVMSKGTNTDLTNVENLLRKVSPKDISGNVLSVAILLNNFKMLELLLKHGANPRSARVNPVYIAITENRDKMIEPLLKHGAEPSFVILDSVKKPLITYALIKNKPKIVELLLKYRAKTNTVDGETGMTPLEAAAYANNHEIARLLLDHGGAKTTTTIRDKNSHSVLFYAMKGSGDVRMIELLLSKSVNPLSLFDESGVLKIPEEFRQRPVPEQAQILNVLINAIADLTRANRKNADGTARRRRPF